MFHACSKPNLHTRHDIHAEATDALFKAALTQVVHINLGQELQKQVQLLTI